MRMFVALSLLCLLALALLGVGVWLSQPVAGRGTPPKERADPDRLRRHVEFLSRECRPRNWLRRDNLSRAAAYIESHLEDAGLETKRQTFGTPFGDYENVIGRYQGTEGPRVIIGAHYDTFEDTPGADDNASGVAVLLEVARLIGVLRPQAFVEFVAYCLEEPPFFRTPHMGSVAHARAMAGDPVPTAGAIVLEMVGFFRRARFSQFYPIPLLYMYYPTRGHFIALASRSDQGNWIREVKQGMKGASPLPIYSIRAPSALPGIDMSDHSSYWAVGIPSLMVTDTAFYRNPHYHQLSDLPDTLDYQAMAHVAEAVYSAVDFIRQNRAVTSER